MTGAEPFGAILDGAGEPVLRDERGRARTLPVDVWLGRAGAVDERVLDRARGPVLDVGCGPGRHVHALARRGVLGVGVDVSPVAVALARRRGATVLEASIFDRLPGTGSWNSALLLDGNIGIGGVSGRAPAASRRTARTRRGACSSSSTRRASASCASACAWRTATRASEWFAWARVGADAVDGPARAAGLRVRARWRDGDRWFAELQAP